MKSPKKHNFCQFFHVMEVLDHEHREQVEKSHRNPHKDHKRIEQGEKETNFFIFSFPYVGASVESYST